LAFKTASGGTYAVSGACRTGSQQKRTRDNSLRPLLLFCLWLIIRARVQCWSVQGLKPFIYLLRIGTTEVVP